MGAVTDQLITQQGSGVLTQYGDYIAAAAGLDQPYRYYVEVPTGTSCLFVDIFDADIGTNAVNNDQANDRDRAIGSYNTTAAYRLTDPSGTSVIADQLFTVGNNAGPAGADNAWLTLFAGSTSDNFRDEFNGVPAYNDNNGSLIWAGNWTEFGDDGAVATGNVQVNVNRLRMRAAVRGATRVADISAAGGCSATLSYTVDDIGNLEGSDCADVSVRSSSSSPYTILQTFCNDIPLTAASHDITPWISSQTEVRFRASNALGGGGEWMAFDDIDISVTGAPAAGHWELEVGHSGLDRFAAAGVLRSEDVGLLPNDEHPTTILALTCVVNRFELAGYPSLGEELVRSTRGGAVAVWAPTGLSEHFQARTLDEVFLARAFADPSAALGDFALEAIQRLEGSPNAKEMAAVYTLLGDPAITFSR